MSQYIVKFAPDAVRELEEAVQWYSDKSSTACAGFRASVIDSVELISNAPLSWRQVTESGIRRIVVDQYPYTVYTVARVMDNLALLLTEILCGRMNIHACDALTVQRFAG